ncbi:restriction endonuclease subunit S [Dokdonia sp. 4H-3-7-5]|uniref:restriction endonuclease subunit S n=1 Tax=Dokdonia sp. (strain 4H-3-7-5) TaxID=983548 RepID=UPI00020A7184|nr:restriction endonuclease subunit S [Dokdonia sp. 4H-3-7-5]AEE20295.1 restriction modification system DNA specificity domain protein [Dokdonia sp. 4H-3-7-5]
MSTTTIAENTEKSAAERRRSKLVPALRFKEFEENWTKKDFGTIVEKAKAKHNPKKSKEEYPCIEMESIAKESSILLEVFNSKDQLSIKNKFSKGEILFGKLRPNLKKYIIAPFDGVCSSEIWVLNGKELSNEFLFRLIQTNKFHSSTLVTSGSKMPRADWAYISSSIFPFPSLPEQQKIASFLSAVDKKIQQLTKKKALLEQYKKGVMQQLFSGQLRFKDENGNPYPDWEEKKMGDILAVRNEQAPKSEQYPLMAFIKHKGVAPKGDRYNREFLVNDGDGKKYKKTEYGDFIYSSNNLDTGSIGLNSYGSACISPVYSIFQIKELYDYQFISRFLVRKSFINKMLRFRQGVVYGQWKIHESAVLTIKEKIPCLEEQQKIATYLSSIDTKIESVHTQITQTQTFKKGLLQQMFV